MNCPKCNCSSCTTIDTVQNRTDNEVYRKRKCRDCGHIFYTSEFEVEYSDQFKKDWNKHYRRKYKKLYDESMCVCCGKYVPEGTQVCSACLKAALI
jgi:transcriptional regulator NrdR family protein